MADHTRNNLIDGWRGLSVLGVVIGHLVTYRYPKYFDVSPIHSLLQEHAPASVFVNNLFFRIASPLGEMGVNFFFVISGYLITHFLLIEEFKNSRISIAAFYVRRAFRIMPAFYAILLVTLILKHTGRIDLDYGAFFRSGFYICNLSGFKCSWWLAHTWSLSVEEQFYLAWPLIFSLFTKSRLAVVSAMLVTLTVASLFLPTLGGFAYIAIGALVASSDKVKRFIQKIATPSVITIVILVELLNPLLAASQILASLISLIGPALVALIFFGTIARKGPAVWLVSAGPIQKLGLISYSVYLWQQLLTAPLVWGNAETGAAALYGSGLLPLLIVAPIASYFLVERPMIALGRKLSEKITRQGKLSTPGDILTRTP
jgi:peptidoglycan/LPS O-acetylase OafA/YrhL